MHVSEDASMKLVFVARNFVSKISLPEFDATMKTSFFFFSCSGEMQEEGARLYCSILVHFFSTAEAIIVKAGKRIKEQFRLSRCLRFAVCLSSRYFSPIDDNKMLKKK